MMPAWKNLSLFGPIFVLTPELLMTIDLTFWFITIFIQHSQLLVPGLVSLSLAQHREI